MLCFLLCVFLISVLAQGTEGQSVSGTPCDPNNGRNCTAIQDYLVFANRRFIQRLEFNNFTLRELYSDTFGNFIALDYDYRREILYWSDMGTGSIFRSNLEGGGVTSVINGSLQVPDGLAIDWLTNKLYWSEAKAQTISVLDLERGHRLTLFSLSAFSIPRGIALDPINGYMFWTDWGNPGKVERAFMDGTGRVAIADTNLVWPNDITIDYESELLYWIDAILDKLESSSYNGSNRQILISIGLFHPFSITFFQNTLYWTDWVSTGAVYFKNTSSSTIRIAYPRILLSAQPMGIEAISSSRQQIASTGCDVNNGGCDQLCLLTASRVASCHCVTGFTLASDGQTCMSGTPCDANNGNCEQLCLVGSGQTAICACFDGYALTDDGRNCTAIQDYLVLANQQFIQRLEFDSFTLRELYSDTSANFFTLDYDYRREMLYWSDVQTGSIFRSNLEGGGVTSVINGSLQVPDGLAIDWLTNKLYWSESNARTISVLDLERGHRLTLFSLSAFFIPKGIALDPINGYMFWTVWGLGNPGKVERAFMDGTGRVAIADTNLAWPNDITIDYETKLLYWVDAGLDRLESSSYNGSNRQILLSVHPFSITFFQNTLYWTDWAGAGAVYFKNTSSSTIRIAYPSYLVSPQPLGIEAVSSSRQQIASTGCDVNNGGCDQLCLLTASRVASCRCVPGFTLASDGQTCMADLVSTISADSTVLAGSSHTVSCQGRRKEGFGDNATLEVEWFGPDRLSLSNETAGVFITGPISTTNLSITSQLTFPSITTSQAGPYTCRVNLTAPEAAIDNQSLQGTTTVRVQIHSPTVTVSPPSGPVYHGTIQTILCQAEYNTDLVDTSVSLEFSWTEPNGALSNNTLFTITSGPTNSNLTLTPVNQPGLSTGDYTCVVTAQPQNNTYITSVNDSDSIRLDTLAAPAPSVTTKVPIRQGRCGNVISIFCNAVTVPNFVVKPTIMWSGPINDSDATLNFPADSALSSGEYTCEACLNVASVGISGLCNSTSVMVSNQVPEIVSGLSCSGQPSDTLELVWDTQSNVLSYQVRVREYSLTGGVVQPVNLSTPFDNEILEARTTVTGLTPAVRYLVSVESVSGVGCSTMKTTVECYTEEGSPPTVGNVMVDRINGTAMNVSWDPINIVEARGFLTFTILYSVSAERNKRQSPQGMVSVSEDGSSQVVGGLDPTQVYDVAVKAENSDGLSTVSMTVQSPATSVLFQFKINNILNCLEWVSETDRINTVTSAFSTEVQSHCQCGFSSDLINDPFFRCFTDSERAVTFRATLTDSRFITAIESWIQARGLIPTQNVLIEVDKTCDVAISSLSDDECTSETPGSSIAVIGGVVGGVVISLIIIIAVTVIIVILVLKKRRGKLVIRNTLCELPLSDVVNPGTLGAVNPCALQSHEMAMMSHEYEDVRKFQQEERENVYAVVGQPEMDVVKKGACYENRNSIVAFDHTYSPSPVSQPSPASHSSRESSIQPKDSQQVPTQESGSENN